jgi:hypothetical protein
MIGNSGGKFTEVWHQQDEHVLANEAFICQPVAPVGKQVRTGGCLVEFGFPDNYWEVASAHLPMRKRLAQGEPGRKLVGRQAKHDHTRMRTLFQETAQAEIPVQVVSLFDGKPANLVLGSQTVPQCVQLHALD